MFRSFSNFWEPWKRHWCFVVSSIVLGPLVGYLVGDDRGLLLGAVVGVFAAGWLLWSQHERQVDD